MGSGDMVRYPGEQLSVDQRSLVANYWWQRAEGEMTSWVGFRHVLEDLRLEAAPAPVLRLAERAVADERRHALWCRDWALAFGHEDLGPVQPRATRPIAFESASPAENRLLRIAFCCLTETVGCFVLREARPRIQSPPLRKLNQRHLADELQHCRVGWGYLSSLDAQKKQVLRAWLPRLLELLPVACAEGPEQDREELVPFGYFTPRLLVRAHQQAIQQVVLPGLHHLGLESAA